MRKAMPIARVTLVFAFVAAILMWATLPQTAEGFAVLGHYDKVNARRWSDNIEPFLEGGLTYSFDADFFGGDPQYQTAVENALQTWANVGTEIYFDRAPYDAVAADDDLLATLPKNIFGIPLGFEGPDWLGANIEFFSRPSSFEYTLWGETRTMGGKLAFAEVITSGGEILSADIYFNQDHSPDPESVALHEIGHALGLDHPEQALIYDEYEEEWVWRNYNPVTYEVEPYDGGWPGTIMWSSYQGVRRELQQEDTGGLQFLYEDLEVPPCKSGAIIRNFTIVNGIFDDVQAYNNAGGFNLSDESSLHYELGLALHEDGLEDIDDPCTGYLLLEQQDVPIFACYTSPHATATRIEFDIALLSGPAADPDAYVAFIIKDTEYFRICFSDLPEGMEFTAFELTEGYQLRTDYYHVTICFDDLPPELIGTWFNAYFGLASDDGGGAPPLLANGETIPEPSTLAAILVSSILLAVGGRLKHFKYHA